MDKLWSPWRSKYISSFKNMKGDEKCIFCKAVSDNLNSDDSLVVVQEANAYVVMNLYPYNNGHLMVVPFRHVSTLNELSEDEILTIMNLVRKSTAALEQAMKPHGFNVGANIGKAAGAGIDTHLHFHIVPRWNGDTNFMPVLGEVKIISQDLLQTRNELRSIFESLK